MSSSTADQGSLAFNIEPASQSSSVAGSATDISSPRTKGLKSIGGGSMTPTISRKSPLAKVRSYRVGGGGSRSGSNISLNGGTIHRLAVDSAKVVANASASLIAQAEKLASEHNSESNSLNNSNNDIDNSKESKINDTPNSNSTSDIEPQSEESTVPEMVKYIRLKKGVIMKTPADEKNDVFTEAFTDTNNKMRARAGSFTAGQPSKSALKTGKNNISMSQERLNKMNTPSTDFGIKRLSKFMPLKNSTRSRTGSIHAFTSSLTKLNKKGGNRSRDYSPDVNRPIRSDSEDQSSASNIRSYSMDGLEEKMERLSFISASKRGVITINSDSMNILTANHNAHSILNHDDQGLLGLCFRDLMSDKRSLLLVESAILKIHEANENILALDGTLLDLKTRTGHAKTVSIWINLVIKSDAIGKPTKTVVAVIESVDSIKGRIIVDDHENMISMDPVLQSLFNIKETRGIPFSRIVPSVPVSLLQEVKVVAGGVDTWFYASSNEEYSPNKQCFPMIIRLLLDHEGDGNLSREVATFPADDGVEYFSLQIDCLLHMGGMLQVTADGILDQGNDTFSNNFFGYHFDDLVGKPVSTILLDFEKLMVQVLKSMDDGATSYSEFETNTVYDSDSSLVTSLSKTATLSKKSIQSTTPLNRETSSSSNQPSTYDPNSSVAGSSSNRPPEIIPGTYEMTSQHYDGGLFKVLVQIKEVFRSDDEADMYYALWITLSDTVELEKIFDVMKIEQQQEEAGKSASGNDSNSSRNVLSSHDLTGDTSIDVNNMYDFGEILGQGSYGSVSLARRKSDNQLVSVKSISKSKLIKEFFDETSNVPKEVVTLKACRHPNIIQFLDAHESFDKHYIVMEYFGDSVDLFQFIDDHPQMEEPLARIIFKQLAEAIAYCHHNKITHRDIKEENVLVNQELKLRLIDFGSATFLESSDDEFKLFFGTLEYASPEVLSGKPYKGMQNDIWAMGITLYSMIYTENPFFEVNETLSGDLHPPFEASPDVFDLIQGMLCVDPTKRYTIDDVIDHPWLNPLDLMHRKPE